MQSEQSSNWLGRAKDHPIVAIMASIACVGSITWAAAWWYYGIQINTKDLEIRQLQGRLEESPRRGVWESAGDAARQQPESKASAVSERESNLTVATGTKQTGMVGKNEDRSEKTVTQIPQGTDAAPASRMSTAGEIEQSFAHVHYGTGTVPTRFPSGDPLDLARVTTTQVGPDVTPDGVENRRGELVRIRVGVEARLLGGELSIRVDETTTDGNPPRAKVTAEIISKDGKKVRIEKKESGFTATLQAVRPIQVRVISVESDSAEFFVTPIAGR